MSTRISLTYCGMDGTGATVKEAKQDAARKIEAALEGSYTPTLLLGFGGDARIVYRSPTMGWSYARLDGKTDGALLWGSSQNNTLEEAIRHARMGLAQDAIFRAPDHGLSLLTDKHQRADHASYVAWQMAAREGKANGISDDKIHAYACDHQHEFIGWERGEDHMASVAV